MNHIARSVLGQLPPPVAVAMHAAVTHAQPLAMVPRRWAVFPVSGIVSIRKAGMGPEIGSIGREGGICLRMADDFELVTHTGATIIHLPMLRFAKLVLAHAEIALLKAQCDDWLSTQTRHIAVCNATHTATKRVARWLLRTGDMLVKDSDIRVSHETIATALGLRRTTVTLIMEGLKDQGIITYRRATITIKDRDRLRAIACDCCSAFDRHRWPRLIPPDLDVDEEAA